MRTIKSFCFLAFLSLAFCHAATPVQAQHHSGWQMHPGKGVVEFSERIPNHGSYKEYRYANVPTANEAGWQLAPDTDIVAYSAPSELIEGKFITRANFTYFQTFVVRPRVEGRIRLRVHSIATGVCVMLQNKHHPVGKALTYLRKDNGPLRDNGEAVIDLTPEMSVGMNRLVLIHLDDRGPRADLRFAKLETDESSMNQEEITIAEIKKFCTSLHGHLEKWRLEKVQERVETVQRNWNHITMQNHLNQVQQQQAIVNELIGNTPEQQFQRTMALHQGHVQRTSNILGYVGKQFQQSQAQWQGARQKWYATDSLQKQQRQMIQQQKIQYQQQIRQQQLVEQAKRQREQQLAQERAQQIQKMELERQTREEIRLRQIQSTRTETTPGATSNTTTTIPGTPQTTSVPRSSGGGVRTTTRTVTIRLP